jgi:hypothetical protein
VGKAASEILGQVGELDRGCREGVVPDDSPGVVRNEECGDMPTNVLARLLLEVAIELVGSRAERASIMLARQRLDGEVR